MHFPNTANPDHATPDAANDRGVPERWPAIAPLDARGADLVFAAAGRWRAMPRRIPLRSWRVGCAGSFFWRAVGSIATRSRGRLLALCGPVTLALAACGGGSDQGSASVAAAAAASAADGGDVHALAVSSAEADPSGWTTIATEGQHFSVTGTQTVRFGSGTAWVTKTVTDGGDCTNAAFGNDPAYGVVKSCQVAVDSASGWVTIAAEGSTFPVAGTQTVRYGAAASWITRQVSGNVDCSNAGFGSDPAYGVVKQCQLPASAVTWSRVAAENAGFTITGTAAVRYGANGAFVTRIVSGSATCGNGYFGNDPAYGVVKSCEVASIGSTTSPPPVASNGICTPPATAVDTSSTTATVGNGTPASCTEAALRAAVASQSVVKFNCGAAAATIVVASQIDIPASRNTVIDGENRITLDGGGNSRILNVSQNNYRTNRNGLTLQHIALRNGRAPGGNYVAPDPSKPQCAYGYGSGSGAAVLVQDARLTVIDVDFQNNAAATPGPDVGGGAIYALGSLDVLISGSRFSGNSGSNGGAVGMLNSDLRVFNSSFSGNTANGSTTPSGDYGSCPGVAYRGQGGAGGSGGAVGIDGGDDGDVTVCGSTFTANRANGLAGAMFRTPDGAARRTTIDRSAFQGNSAPQAGAVYVMNSAPLDVLASTFAGNKATLFGAAQLQGDQFNIVNSTFSGNEATAGVGGALGLANTSSASTIVNSTFADNKASGGSGYFSAAIFGDSNFAIRNTVFSSNLTSDPYNPMQCFFSANPGSNDVQWPTTRAVGGAADTPCVSGITFADPQLGALADNGGPTPSRAPAAASPLRNAGRNCPATDQRGNARNTANCTIGAVE